MPQFTPGMDFGEYLGANFTKEQLDSFDTNDFLEQRKLYKRYKDGRLAPDVAVPGQDDLADFDFDPNDVLQQQFGRLADPRLHLDAFQAVAAAGTPSTADFLARTAALGGSAAQAREQQEAFASQARGGAFNAFRQYRTGLEGIRSGLAGDIVRTNQAETAAALGFAGQQQQAALFNAQLQQQYALQQQQQQQALWGGIGQLLGGLGGLNIFGRGTQQQGGIGPPNTFDPFTGQMVS